MPILSVFSGLPGAGKSTRASALQQQTGAVMIARDPLRQALTGLGCEWALTLSLVCLARVALQAGKSVIVDAPNLDPADRALWTGLAAESGARLDWEHLATPLPECIRRDAGRPQPIGAEHVGAMAERYRATLDALSA